MSITVADRVTDHLRLIGYVSPVFPLRFLLCPFHIQCHRHRCLLCEGLYWDRLKSGRKIFCARIYTLCTVRLLSVCVYLHLPKYVCVYAL